jgi:hypothetical protein
MSKNLALSFHDNPAISGREAKFVTLKVAVFPILASWRNSLFAHEWLKEDGSLRPETELPDEKLVALQKNIAKLKQGEIIPRPVLGLGLTDSVEIGSGKDILMACCYLGLEKIEAHIPASHADEFKIFVRD